MFIHHGLYFLLNCYRRIDGTRQRIFFHRSINSNIWLCSYLYCLTYSFQAIKSISIADVNQTKHIDNLCTIFFSRCSICYSLPKANTFIVIILLLLAQIFYFYIIIQLPKLLKRTFFASIFSFHIPFSNLCNCFKEQFACTYVSSHLERSFVYRNVISHCNST